MLEIQKTNPDLVKIQTKLDYLKSWSDAIQVKDEQTPKPRRSCNCLPESLTPEMKDFQETKEQILEEIVELHGLAICSLADKHPNDGKSNIEMGLFPKAEREWRYQKTFYLISSEPTLGGERLFLVCPDHRAENPSVYNEPIT